MQRNVASRRAARRSTSALTPWGIYVAEYVAQHGYGILTDAQLDTGISYSTVHLAQRRLVRKDVAVLLSKFAKGAFTAESMTAQRRMRTCAARGRRRRRLRGKAAA